MRHRALHRSRNRQEKKLTVFRTVAVVAMLSIAATVYLHRPNHALPDQPRSQTTGFTLTPTKENPFAAATESETESTETAKVNTALNQEASDIAPLVDIARIEDLGRSDWTEEQFDSALKLLAANPKLLKEVARQFRNEADPSRRKRLIMLLGKFHSPWVIDTAAELLYTGDAELQQDALNLLSRIPSERTNRLIIGVLESEAQPHVLTTALVAIASAKSNKTQANLVQTRLSGLVSHQDPTVRRTSMAALAHWSDSDVHTPTLMAGLTDADDDVRKTVAYAFVDYAFITPEASAALFRRAEDDSEAYRTRRGAILALQRSDDLTDAERQRLNILADSVTR